MYKYEYNREDCPYLKVCDLANTNKCNHSCHKYMEMDFLIYSSGIPPKRKHVKPLYPGKYDMDSFIALNQIKEDIVDFVYEGRSLYIASNYFGNGKTSWAIKLLLNYFNAVWYGNCFKVRGLFVHVPTFLAKLKDSYSTRDPEFEKLKRLLPIVDIVVWDDIAASHLTNNDHTMLLSYIDQRVLNEKSNIYTGNADEEQINTFLGKRLTSRVYNISTVIELNGEDRR